MENSNSKPNGDGPRPWVRLREILDARRGQRQAVAIRGYPDPDSIGSALAHAFLCRRFEIEPVVLYFQDVSHQENRALVKKLDIEMLRYAPGLDLTGLDGLAFVDTQKVDLPDEIQRVPVVSVVDHHKQMDVDAEFRDIREDAGSTCSIYAEYLMAAGSDVWDRDDPDVARLATAMAYGIRSDTDDFLLAREIDHRAAAFLAPLADRDLLLSVSKQSISPRAMEIIHRAYANKAMVDTYLVAGVEFVRDEDRDSIGQAADYLLRREGIDTVLCYGVVNNQFVDGSLRTTSHTVDPDRFLKALLGVDTHEVPYGGGRRDKGAFKIPLGPFANCGDKEVLWKMVQRTIEDLFFQKIGINRSG